MSRKSKGCSRSARLVMGLLLSLLGFVFAGCASESGPVTRRALACGLTLIFEKDTSSSLTSLCLLVRGGLRAEPEGQAGLAFLATRLLLEIPDSRSAQTLMQQASAAGMAVQGDFSLISINSLSSYFGETLRLVSGTLLDPLFSRIRLDNIKRSMLHQEKVAEDDPRGMGHEAQVRAVFEGCPYAGPVLGTEKTLDSITGKDVSTFYRTSFRAGNVVLAVISDLDEGAVAAMIEKSFKGFPGGPPPPPPSPLKPFLNRRRESFFERRTSQTLISYGFRLPPLTARSYALGALIENFLGKGPASRLWPLRQEQMLAYSIDANLTPQKDAGLLEVYLETDEARKDAAAAALENVLAEVNSGRIGLEEFEALKTMTKADFLRDEETKERRTADLAAWEALGLGAEYLDRFAEEIEAISVDELQGFIRGILDVSRASRVVVGPKDLGPKKSPAPKH
jgi:zinc protease